MTKGWKNEPGRHALSSYGIETTSKGNKRRWDESTITRNIEMNDEVYQLRREVINIIYDVKDMVDDLPRITVRVVEPKSGYENVLGVARLEDDIIWVNKKVIEEDDYPLRQIVYHEILHGVYGIDDDKDDLLMHPTQTFPSLTREELDHLFMKHVKESDKG